MIPWIETARGVLNAASICSASPRVAAVAFGAEDYARDMQLPHEVSARACGSFVSRLYFSSQASTNHDALRTARSIVAMAAHSCGVQPLDGPFVKFKDRLLSASVRSHPTAHSHSAVWRLKKKLRMFACLDTLENLPFIPTKCKLSGTASSRQMRISSETYFAFEFSSRCLLICAIRWAFRVVRAMEAAEREGRASTSLDGIMIDTPVYTRCKQLLLSEQLLKSTHK